MALSSTPDLLSINVELGVTGKGLVECIALVGRTGVWNGQLDFAGYSAFVGALSVLPTSLNFIDTGESKIATVTSNTTWSVSDNASWVSISGASGDGNDSFTITCSPNTGDARNAIVSILWSGTTRTISIYQEQSGEQCPT